jgi:hypothetical protein
MKTIFLIISLIASLNSFAQNKSPKFILAFGNDFDGDSVSIIINQIQVAKNIKLKPTMISPENLWIEQNSTALEVRPHNQPKLTLKKIKIKNSLLHLKIGMNNIWYDFNFDLRKGKSLIAKYSNLSVDGGTRKVLIIEQTDLIQML